jgi:ATP-dependent DNA helicase DinG
VIEVEVHQQLRLFLREQGEPHWHHHLTMARLVARALRLGRSALIQTGAFSGHHGCYRLSYLVPILLWHGPVILVASESVQQRLLMVEIPRLRQWMQTTKAIRTGDRWISQDFQGLLLTTPQAWLGDRLSQQNCFPSAIPTLIDGVDDLENWTHDELTASIQPMHWDELMLTYPAQADTIRNTRVQLTKILFQHPANPYECHLVDSAEQEILRDLYHVLQPDALPLPLTVEATSIPLIDPTHRSQSEIQNSKSLLPPIWQKFWQRFFTPEALVWAEMNRRQGQFLLRCGAVEVASSLAKIWSQQPVVLVGSALDLDATASIYRQRVGLEDLTCLKFSPDRQAEAIQLYLPDRIPMPNTPEFQAALLQQIRALLSISTRVQGLTVLLVGDVPLKAQMGSILAAEFGSRVQVEKTCLDENGILVTGWQFWRQHQSVLPTPHLLAIATLPIPSLEHPLVAGRVAYYKRQRQDWFRLYLLPEALSELQRAIAPIRDRQGVVALFDSRVIHRSYGQQVLSALSPLARINYLDQSLFHPIDE